MRNLLYCLSLSMFVLLSGCSGGDTPEYGSLSGKVMLNGEAAPSGIVLNFVNSENGAATSAQVQDGGTYTIPRIQVGKYNVGVSSQDSSSTEEVDPDAAMKQIEAGTYKEPKPKLQIPEKFTAPEESPLTVTVGVGDNTQDFDVK